MGHSRRLVVLVYLGVGVGCTWRIGFGPPGDSLDVAGGDAASDTPSVCTGTALSAAADSVPPTVLITSPAVSTISGVVTVAADASDDLHLVGVRFYLGDVLLGAEDDVAPFEHRLDTTALPNGAFVLRAVARDGAQNNGEDTTTVTVANPSPIGATYYACDCRPGASAGCVAGADTNPGTSAAAPVVSGVALQSLLDSAGCGDAVLLCRGGSLERNNLLIPPPLTCSGNPLRIGAYTPSWAGPQSPRPMLTTTNGHAIYIGGDIVPRIGIVIEDIHFLCGNCTRGDARTGIFLHYAGADEIVVRRVEIEGFDWGFHASENRDVTLEYSHIHHSLSRGTIGGAVGLVVRRNLFEHNGCIGAATDGECQNDWNVAFSTGVADPGVVFVGNEITRTSVDSQGRCRAASLVCGSGGVGAVFSDNYIHEPVGGIGPNCAGMFLHGASTFAEGCADCRIFNNRIENSTGGIIINAMPRVEIFNNTIALGADPGTSIACVGISAFARIGAADLETTDVRIYNNSIYIGRDGMLCGGVSLADTGQNHVIANNLIAYTGQSPEFDCFVIIDPTQVATMDHNVCVTTQLTATPWVRTGAGRVDFTAWQAAEGSDTGSADAGVAFVTPAPPFYDLHPAACSDTTALTGDPATCPAYDYAGIARSGGTCVVGAFAGF